MDALVNTLEESRATLRWYAMGEAVRLEERLRAVLQKYSEKQTKANAKEVIGVATDAALFLTNVGSQQVSREIRGHLDRLRIEGKIK